MNFKSIIISSVLLMSAPSLFASSCTATTTSNIAVVDMHTLLEKSPQVETMRTDLEKQFASEHDSLAKAQESLQAKAKKLDTDSSVMTKTALDKAKSDLSTEQQSLQARQMKFQQAVYAAQDKAMQKILDKVTSIVASIAKSKHFDLVVPKNSTIYAVEGSDITTMVQAQLTK